MPRALLLALAFSFAAACAWAQPPKAGPLASAADIRAFHAAPTGLWRLTYRQEDENGAPATLVLSLAPDYVARQGGGSETQIFDFATRRVYALAAEGADFHNDSLHAFVLFRINELRNRQMLGKVMSAAVPDKAMPALDSFQAETELSMQVPPGAQVLRREQAGQTLRLWRGDAMVAEAALGPQAPSALRPALIRLWRHAVPQHPEVARALAECGCAPARLEVQAAKGLEVGRRRLMLEKAEWIERADFPLPAAATLAADTGSPATQALAQAARQAAATGARSPDRATYVGRMHAAQEQGQPLEAALWGMEAVLASGLPPAKLCQPNSPEPFCQRFRQVWQAAASDSRAAALFGRGPLRDTPFPDLSGLSSAHVGRLLVATRMVMGGAGGDAVEQAYLAALNAAPGVVNYYKDVGDYYCRTYRHPTGWLFYDLARALPGHTDADMLADIDRMEARLVVDFPELY